MSKLFGGSKQKSQSESYNKAYPAVSGALSPVLGNVKSGSDAIAAMLGIGGDAAGQRAAFDNYRDSAGWDFLMDAGREAIIGGNASRGLFRSGATGKALVNYGQELGKTFLNNYLDRLFGYSNLGIQSANAMTGAGGYSKSTQSGSSKKGLGDMIGPAAAAIAASDRRLKENINMIDTFEDGLNVYTWNYIGRPKDEIHIGVMADEVEKLRPEALGPILPSGYATVNYSMIKEFV